MLLDPVLYDLGTVPDLAEMALHVFYHIGRAVSVSVYPGAASFTTTRQGIVPTYAIAGDAFCWMFSQSYAPWKYITANSITLAATTP